jgi:hypothetical protein
MVYPQQHELHQLRGHQMFAKLKAGFTLNNCVFIRRLQSDLSRTKLRFKSAPALGGMPV